MKRVFWLIAAWLVTMGFLVTLATRKKPEPTPQPLGPISSFSFLAVTSDGARPMRTEDLKGHVWVANFIFTRCGGPCPVMSGKMAALQRVLDPQIRLVSFTVDPDFDKAPVLQAYARRFRADPQRWIFAHLPKDPLIQVMQSDFKLALGNSPDEGIIHSTRFVLVDKRGVIRGTYESEGDSLIPRIRKDSSSALFEKFEKVHEELNQKAKNH